MVAILLKKKLKGIGEKGVSVMICDSTNVFSPEGQDQSLVRKIFLKLWKPNQTKFWLPLSLQMSQEWSQYFIAQKTGRSICLVGRSMQRIYKAAKKCGYLENLADLLSPRKRKIYQKIKFYI